MDFNAVKALLAPMADERIKASLRCQLGGQRHEKSVMLEEVGLDRLARKAFAERDGKGELRDARPA